MVAGGGGLEGWRVSTSNIQALSMRYSLFHFQWLGGESVGGPPQTQSLSSGFYSCKDPNSGKKFLLHVQILYITDRLGVETNNLNCTQSKHFLGPVYEKCIPYSTVKHFHCLGFI